MVVVTAYRNRELLEAAGAFVREHATRGEVLVLAGVKAAADEISRAHAGAAVAGVHRYAVRDLAWELASDLISDQGLAPVSRLGREAIAARIADQALRDGALRYFGPVAGMGGFAAALAETLQELRLSGIGETQLAEAGERGADLALFLRLYTAELAAHQLADRAGRYELALRAIEGAGHPLVGVPLVIYCVEPRHALEKRWIGALAEKAREVLVLAGDAGAPKDIRRAGDQPASQTALECLQERLFTERAEPTAAVGGLEIFAASGEALECVEIARAISALAAAGTPFDRVAVLLRSPERYGQHLREALRRARIPGFYTRAARRPNPAGRAFLVLLECAANGLRATDFAEYLSLAQTPLEVPAPMRWERFLVDAGVGSGAERWRSRLNALEEEWRDALAGAEGEDHARLERNLEALDSLREFAVPLIGRLDALPAQASWRVWLDLLQELAGHALAEPEVVREVLDELEPMAEIGPVTLHGVVRVLRGRLRFLSADSAETRYGRVFVGSIDDARGLSFDAVFVPGLNEGMFPARWSQDPLLPDAVRGGIGMPAAPSDIGLLQSAASAAGNLLYLSYSNIDLLTGRTRVPSFYLFEAYEAAYGVTPDVARLQKDARARVPTRAGWPAPRDPAEAIDDAEFDLAWLAPAMRHPDRAPGAGAYLSQANPHLARALRSRWKRWGRPWSDADGLIEPTIQVPSPYEPFRLRSHAYSPTELEHYAVCPYRFWLRSVLGLRPAGNAAQPQRMAPDVRGRLFHQVQTQFLREVLASGSAISADPEMEARLDAALDCMAAEYAARVAPAIPGVWAAEVERMRIDLRGWLHQMASEPDWGPVAMEWAFGLDDLSARDPQSRREPVEILEGYRLEGSVDLIQRHTSGALRAVDHKTGRIPQPRPESIGKGEALQPLLYALAIEQAFGGRVTGGRLFYATLRQNYRSIDIALNEIHRARVRQVLSQIDSALERGFLPAAPRQDACKQCDYHAVCGPYEEERVRRKPHDKLQALSEIRRIK